MTSGSDEIGVSTGAAQGMDEGMTQAAGLDAGSNADVAFIRALAEILRESDLTELQVERERPDGRLDVALSRAALAAPPAASAQVAAPLAVAAPAVESPTAPAEDPALLPGAVTSPMVGTAYLAPEPGAANFIALGDQVAEGQTLLIVEAMKTMNQIPAPRAGRVARILVENGAPVEFGAPLVILE